MVDFDKDGERSRAPYVPPQAPSGYYPPPGYVPGYPGYRYAPAGPPQAMPPSNIGWAIGALLLFWPLAIPAFIFSSRVDGYWFSGNAYGAQKASSDARLYGMIGVIVGVVIWVITIVIILVAFVFVANTVHEINQHLPTYAPS